MFGKNSLKSFLSRFCNVLNRFSVPHPEVNVMKKGGEFAVFPRITHRKFRSARDVHLLSEVENFHVFLKNMIKTLHPHHAKQREHSLKQVVRTPSVVCFITPKSYENTNMPFLILPVIQRNIHYHFRGDFLQKTK